jgi:hypothetical protein
MSSNKLDPIHAVANMALAMIEIQKDLAVLNRKYIELADTVVKMDSALIGKFSSVDKILGNCVELLKELPNAANTQRKEGNGVDEENLRRKESEERILCNDKRREAEGCGGEKEI